MAPLASASLPTSAALPTASRLTRRGLLGLGGVSAAAATLPWSQSAAAKPIRTDPFTLGVASGEPTPDGIVLWTRLATDPVALDGRGGMPSRQIPVKWELATDPRFTRVVRRGVQVTSEQHAHSVHVEVGGLAPAREYWYRFSALGFVSMIGRTKTAPAPGTRPTELSFAFVSCQNLPAGYFTAYQHLAAEQFDVVLHLGDYIYEGVGASTLPGHSHLPAAETFSLADYRVRHAQYKLDPLLQAAHASAPWIAVPDDHEVENDYAGDHSQPDNEPDQDPRIFRQRRADAYQAYWEHLPFKVSAIPAGPDMQLYRRLSYGNLAEFHMLDTRQYRSTQLTTCAQDCSGRWDPSRSLFGLQQEKWLTDGLAASTATWKILGNQVYAFDTDDTAGPGVSYNMDKWSGYAASRQRVFDSIANNGVQNLVSVTGDAHRNAASELRLDFRDENSPVIGVDFLGTSITSGGDGVDLDKRGKLWLAECPWVKFVNVQRGYQRVRVTPQLLTVDYRVVPFVTSPDAPVSTRASITVEAGRPGFAQLD